jgi:cytochrome c-type biogenesis protein CcmH
MIAFWAAAGLLAAAASILILWSARRAKPADEQSPETQLYARQLDEVEELHARGLLGEEERRAARAEAARRLLAAADKPRDAQTSTGSAGRAVLLAVAIGTPLVALGLYAAVGDPGREDQPYAQRLKQWRETDPASLEPQALIAVAEQLAKERPTEPEIWRLLGRARLQVGDNFGAVQALERAARIGNTAEDWAVLGSALTDANNGTAGPEAVSAYEEALKRDPTSAPARFGLAQAQAEAGDRAGAAAAIRAIAASLPPHDPRRPVLEAEAQKLAAVQTP